MKLALFVLSCFLSLPAMASPATPKVNQAAERMKSMDTDGDGKVSYAEFLALPAKLFGNLDRDRDGFISTKEFEANIAAQEKSRSEAVARVSQINKERALASQKAKLPAPKPVPRS